MTYYHWKTRSPDDDWDDPTADDYPYEDEPCDHEDYDINIVDGRASCHRCGESWYASEEEILNVIDGMAAYAQYEERENRRQGWRDIWYSVKSFFSRRRPKQTVTDDDLPF